MQGTVLQGAPGEQPSGWEIWVSGFSERGSPGSPLEKKERRLSAPGSVLEGLCKEDRWELGNKVKTVRAMRGDS